MIHALPDDTGACGGASVFGRLRILDM
jgi:hypothetical protein